jgi:hypothetical protein
MKQGMPKAEVQNLYLSVHARLVFLTKENERAVLDLMRRFSSAVRFAYSFPFLDLRSQEIFLPSSPSYTDRGRGGRQA